MAVTPLQPIRRRRERDWLPSALLLTLSLSLALSALAAAAVSSMAVCMEIREVAEESHVVCPSESAITFCSDSFIEQDAMCLRVCERK